MGAEPGLGYDYLGGIEVFIEEVFVGVSRVLYKVVGCVIEVLYFIRRGIEVDAHAADVIAGGIIAIFIGVACTGILLV